MKTVLRLAGVLVCLAIWVGLTGCQNPEVTQRPDPPPFPSQQKLEERFARAAEGKWEFWSTSAFVYAVQRYCAYTEECRTEHLWLGPDWGYAFPSYRTIMFGKTITVPGVFRVLASQVERCSAGKLGIPTYQYVTGQVVLGPDGKRVHYFCIEPHKTNQEGGRGGSDS